MPIYFETVELTHLAMGDYDCIEEQDDYTCGSLKEHLERNSCPKKEGKIGDIHFELYVQQDLRVVADSKKEADKIMNKICNVDKLIDEYLLKYNITDFNSEDFDGDTIICEEIIDKTSTALVQPMVSDMRIVHEKMYYDNEN